MIDATIINSPAVVRHYMLANTPRYLFRNLRREPSVALLAESSTPQELLAAITDREQRAERTVEDVAIAYAMLVALSFQNYPDVKAALVGWTSQVLSWAEAILSLIEESVAPVTLATVHAHETQIVRPVERDEIPSTILMVVR